MNKGPLLALVAAAVVLVVLYSGAYTVNETEQVVIVQFGEVMGGAVTTPGLHFKIPFIQDAKRFEKRWLEWDGEPNQITTLDKRYIYVDVFARWRIGDPLLFIESLRDEQSAQGRLDDILDNAVRNVVANHNLIEAIRSSNRRFSDVDEESAIIAATTDLLGPGHAITAPDGSRTPASPDAADAKPEEAQAAAADAAADEDRTGPYHIEVGREKITRSILEKASVKAAQLGIELKDIQIQRIDYIESVQAKVFDRMNSERQRVAEAFRSQGRGRSAEILGQMEKELRMIRSEAYRTSQEITGKADAEAAAIYASAYKQDADLYTFLKTLESYRQTVDENSWIVLSTGADYARHLESMKGAVP